MEKNTDFKGFCQDEFLAGNTKPPTSICIDCLNRLEDGSCDELEEQEMLNAIVNNECEFHIAKHSK